MIGVVRDFNYKSLRTNIEPFVMIRNNPESGERLMVINVSREGIHDTLQEIQGLFAELDPVHPFEYTFLDADLDRLYVSEERLMRLTGIFAAICIFVACLGLFGLAASATAAAHAKRSASARCSARRRFRSSCCSQGACSC